MRHFNKTISALLAVFLLVSLFAGCASAEAAVSVNLSSLDYDFQAEYFYSDYNALSNADEDHQDGIDTFENKDIVFKSLYLDELLYLLQQEGNYLILFGGSWDHYTRAAIGYVNEFAKEYGIDTVYNFDFRLDGATEEANILQTAVTPEFGGESVTVADWNYYYGELVNRYLSNLNDWVEYKEDTENALTWFGVDYEEQTIAKVQVPFLFLYNKDNTTHYVPVYDDNGKQIGVEADESVTGTFPIVYGFEELVDKDSTGVYAGTDEAGNRNYITDAYTERLRGVFDFVKDNSIEINYYTDADYLYDAFIVGNGRGHAEKLYDIFTDGEQINIEVIPYRQLNWLLAQEGSAAILFGGAWCANTTAGVGPINDYAVANDIKVYMIDFRLDGKHPIDFWGYDRDREFRISGPAQEGKAETSTYAEQPNPFAFLYTNLVDTYLTNLEVSKESYQNTTYVVDGTEVQRPRVQFPYFFAYNKDAVDEDGSPTPVLAWYEEMLEVTEKSLESGSYMYNEDNYASYTSGIESVLTALAETTGGTYVPYSGEPRQEIITNEGEAEEDELC